MAVDSPTPFNTLRPRQNRCHFPDDTFKPIFLNENSRISIKILLKFVPKVPINNIAALVGAKPLSEPMMVCLLTQICVTQPQWVNPCHIEFSETWNMYAFANHFSTLSICHQTTDQWRKLHLIKTENKAYFNIVLCKFLMWVLCTTQNNFCTYKW